MSLTITIQEIIQQADAYAQIVLHDLSPSKANLVDPVGFGRTAHDHLRLKIYFLFPQLSEMQRRILSSLYWLHELMELLILIDRQKLNLPDRTVLEKVTAKVEQKYMSVVDSIRKIISFQQLSDLQQRIFRTCFSEIRFPEIAAGDSNAGAGGISTRGTGSHAL